jgi:hypothetical protein
MIFDPVSLTDILDDGVKITITIIIYFNKFNLRNNYSVPAGIPF